MEKPGRLCEVDEDAESAGSEHEELGAMFVICVDDDSSVARI